MNDGGVHPVAESGDVGAFWGVYRLSTEASEIVREAAGAQNEHPLIA